jgi:hypothetical protein
MSLLVIITQRKTEKQGLYIYLAELAFVLLLVDTVVMVIDVDRDHKINNFSYVSQYLVLSYDYPTGILTTFDATKIIYLFLKAQGCTLQSCSFSSIKRKNIKITLSGSSRDARTFPLSLRSSYGFSCLIEMLYEVEKTMKVNLQSKARLYYVFFSL